MNYKEYLKSDHWIKTKRLLKKNNCQICGFSKLLDLHHITYKNVGREQEKDLLTLCRFCHYTSHEYLPNMKRKRMKKPSRCITKIARIIINGGKLKKTSFCIFLRRRHVVINGDNNIPSFKLFKEFFKNYIENKEYPFDGAIYRTPI